MLTGTLITAAGFLPIAMAQSSTGEYTRSIFQVAPRPSQNAGVEMPVTARVRAIWSMAQLWYTADSTPSGTPTTTGRPR